jgi:hypothetical protein
LESTCFSVDNTSLDPNGPNGYIDITTAGGTPPYTYLWDDGSTLEDHQQLWPGTYTVVVTDANGFSYTTSCTVGGTNVGMEELTQFGFSLEQNIPNPANGTTVIPFVSELPRDYVFTITAVDGRVAFEQNVRAQTGMNRVEVALHNLSAGAYYYSLSNGTDRMTKRMMVMGDQK